MGRITQKLKLGGVLLQRSRPGVAPDVPPSMMPRLAAMAGIAAIWSLVTVTPLFVTVGLQTQSDKPPLNTSDQLAAVRAWEPVTWDTQVTRKTPIPAVTTISPAFERPWLMDRWPTDTWETQYTRKVPIPDRHDPPAYSFPLLVDRWPQPEWPSQTTLKVNPYRTDNPVTKTRADGVVLQWPPLDWSTQVTLKTPIPNVVVAQPATPYVPELASPIWLWPQAEWPTQVTLKTPIPDRHDPPAWSDASSQPITQWEPTTWTLPVSRYTPVLPVVVAPDNPPADSRHTTLMGLVGTWPQDNWPAQRSVFSSQSGLVVASTIAYTRDRIALDASWVSTWYEQPKRILSVNPAQVDNPPMGQRLWLHQVQALWIPLPHDAITHAIVLTPSGPVVVNTTIPRLMMMGLGS